MTEDNFQQKNNEDWDKIHKIIFGDIIPSHSEWTNIEDIINLLNKIGNVSDSNHMFIPNSGGMDLIGAGQSNEDNCIELYAGHTYIVKPIKLIFENIDHSNDWNYFRLETGDLAPSGVYDDRSPLPMSENVLELNPLHYIERRYWDDQEYNGKPLPTGARSITRFFHGSFAIFKKMSPYNLSTGEINAYQAHHEKLGAEKFKEFIISLSKRATISI